MDCRQDLISSYYDYQAFAVKKENSHQSDTIRERNFAMQAQVMMGNDPRKSTQWHTLRSWRLWCFPGPMRHWGIGHLPGSRILGPATPSGRASGGLATSSVTSPPLMFGLQTRPTSILWFFWCGAQSREMPTGWPATPRSC